MNPITLSDAIVEEIAIEASAERIFAALTNPEERMKWWGSAGRFQVTQCESDLRPGGRWMMRGDGTAGRTFTVTGEYREIDPPRVLVFTWLADWYEGATETMVRWDLEERGGATMVRLTHTGLTSEAARTSHRGWPQILEWLRAWTERE